ncbi:hypothetical protein AYM40_09780 [Paraburkholderia phytofirmans OLGA172]|uniref:Uncharacterized protein n=1 Tax=Paraburkholderia phytofirmans OLGA172 TaxID=1417228 RepID=A0A160FK67_9BURK|nr:hypothetical protein [Paraburkholderia phytofirmans]ANB72624.1 hypothetical protein AYM40_09780 [Paraburkholderia phytofirmans OLGA172]
MNQNQLTVGTMTLREMLESAAKTMSLTLLWSTESDLVPRVAGTMQPFNPHIDDGAAYRLLVFRPRNNFT